VTVVAVVVVAVVVVVVVIGREILEEGTKNSTK